MKGLILKDLYQLADWAKSTVLFLVFILVVPFFFPDSMFFAFYPCMLCGMVPDHLLSRDERSRWDVYCGTLPCSKAQVVSGKFLISIVSQLLVFIYCCILQAVRMSVTGMFSWSIYLVFVVMLLLISSFNSSVMLLFVFKFGTEKANLVSFVSVLVGCATSLLASYLLENGYLTNVTLGGLITVLCLAAVGIYALSWYLSIKVYEKREIT